MQAKGLVKFFAIIFSVVCLFQLSFTLKSYYLEQDANAYAENVRTKLQTEGYSGDTLSLLVKSQKQDFLDSLSFEKVYNLGVANYTFDQVRDKKINLGLDLQGGMSVILEVSIADMLQNLAKKKKNDVEFATAIKMANEKLKSTERNYIDLFIESVYEQNPNTKFALMFASKDNDLILPGMTNEEVEELLRTEAEQAIKRTKKILEGRIDKFGVTSPTITRIENSGRIMVELPGADNPKRIRRQLQSAAALEFWKTYQLGELGDKLTEADQIISNRLELQNQETTSNTNEGGSDSTITDEFAGLDEIVDTLTDTSDFAGLTPLDTSSADQSLEEALEGGNTPFLSLLRIGTPIDGGMSGADLGISGDGPVMGMVLPSDTQKVNRYLNDPQIKALFPRAKFLWGVKPETNDDFDADYMALYAMKMSPQDDNADLSGDIVLRAAQSYNNDNGKPNITMQMTANASDKWKRLTTEYKGKYVAIVLDGKVYSAPIIVDVISGGNTEISGNFQVDEAKDLAAILEVGKLPAKANLLQITQVGPTLGAESVRSGLISLIAGLLVVLLFMIFYYTGAGLTADFALITNIFFIFGTLASLGTTLTLPGIAGIVLTIGMAVDANVIIFERVREEIIKGKGARLALEDGFKHSLPAIIDANVTTLITAFILSYFGMGPIKGFAYVLMIGIFSSFFTAVMLSRLVFDGRIRKDKPLKFGSKMTLTVFSSTKMNFLGKRKMAYALSSLIILGGIISFTQRSFDLGVDFKGGRAYSVRFAEPVSPEDVGKALASDEFFGQNPVVKTEGSNNQLKITTAYLQDVSGEKVDSIVQSKLFLGLQPFLGPTVTEASFTGESLLLFTKVEPTIADDIKTSSLKATIFALIAIFLYILLRFRRWQFSVGALVALGHDVLIILSLFTFFHNILPFSLEIDQAIIGALLTVIGYSINDTVVVFDRVRETINSNLKSSLFENVNKAINSTLSRTLITSFTTLIVMVVLFVFGPESIRGFSFAIMMGVLVGTYSSIFIATPIMTDLTKKTKFDLEKPNQQAGPKKKSKATA